MYELIILSHLMRQPMHGYRMSRIINDMIGPFARVSHGRFYPLLGKLEADGLIAATDDAPDAPRNNRRQRTFRITDTGRARWHDLMLDTSSNPGEYSKLFWQKVPFLDDLAPTERLYLLDHYLHYCQTHIFHLTTEMDDLEREVARGQYMTADQLTATLHVFRHHLAQWRLDHDHAAVWRTRELARSAVAVTPFIGSDTVIDRHAMGGSA